MDRWANLIVNRYLCRRWVCKAFWGTIWSTIAYPLPVMTLTEEHREWFKKEIYRKLLPEMRVNRIFPPAYCHASKMFQMMGLP